MGRLLVYGAAVTSVILLSLIYAILVAGGSGSVEGSPGPSAADDGEVVGEITISAFDLGFEPATVDVAEPGTYTVHFMNDGAIVHDLTFADGTTQVAQPGEMVMFEVTIPAGGTTFLCSVPGHADGGMTGTVTVAGEGPSGGDGHGGPVPTTDVEPDPNAPDYALYPPEAPARLDGEVHDIELVIEEKPMTVAQGDDGGFVQGVWTFNGTVPGPVIRVKVGDTFRVHLVNPESSQVGH